MGISRIEPADLGIRPKISIAFHAILWEPGFVEE
jgi:hypothetical protein